MLLFLATIALALAAFLVAEVATLPTRQRTLALRRAAVYGRAKLGPRFQAEPFRKRVLEPSKDSLARWVLKLNPKTTVESVGARLLSAGLGRSITPKGFLAVKGALTIGGVLLGAIVGGSLAGSVPALLAAVVFGAAGFFFPDLLVTLRARRRRERIRTELPDALDLLTVSVEAGLGFDGALSKLTEHMEGPLAEECSLTLNEMRIGESRQEALKRFAERVDAPEVQAFVRAIIQSDQLGMSLGRILRVQAADARLRRQAAAEERAMKAPIKMLFPTVIFVFPAMFLVVLGPAFLNLMKVF
jgi:tight adherence protein C